MAISFSELDSLSMVWWNVALSPPSSSTRDKASIGKIEKVSEILSIFINKKYDLICLGEVSTEDMRKLSKLLNLEELKYSYIEGADKQGLLYFDTAVIYSDKLVAQRQANNSYCFHEVLNITDRNSVKLYERYIFRIKDVDDDIVLYLSHWPSQLRNSEIQTTQIAINLKSQIREILEEQRNVILMGDYNLEPYDKCIVNYLGSSRSKEEVMRNKTMLYNPCWKLLIPNDNDIIYGSYFYAQGHYHKWQILDQCMFSLSFLEKPWFFDDNLVSIIDVNKLYESNGDINPSDHWPISCTIFRK
ncbi:MAG: hypothetical protein GAK29_00978 [Acinetobacter bereziniae]|uniref:Endonuclease/exonuclease/phosphatase domain-containing protein n=1 Tax=Acinetobacter bereziniae TaxID=106648 RepID=A0A833PHV7_ACIBZ|nr:MAG: hypothetical protein GAK29_00978 [Acinetobacter bereziniae]